AAPAGSVAAVQGTTWPAALQVQPAPAALTKVAPAGRGWVTVTVVAALGPRVLTPTVDVIDVPALTGVGGSGAGTARSARLVTVDDTDALLLASAGSAVAAPTVADAVMVPPADGAVAVIAIAGAAPVGTAAAVQVTVWPLLVQLQPAPVALTKAAP